MLTTTILAAALLLGPSASRPRVQLLVNPSTCLQVPGEGCHIGASVLIEDPGPDWYCPRVEILWAEGFKSVMESDCDPYEKLDEDARRWFRSGTRYMRFGPGDHVITATLTQGAKTQVVTRSVIVR